MNVKVHLHTETYHGISTKVKAAEVVLQVSHGVTEISQI
jgi:hypothetical protein